VPNSGGNVAIEQRRRRTGTAAASWRMVQTQMLLQHCHVGERPAAQRTRADRGGPPGLWRPGSVDAHVGFEVALGGEGAATQATAERTDSGMRAVVHEQGAAAAQRPQTDGALVDVELTLRPTCRQLHVRTLGTRVLHLRPPLTVAYTVDLSYNRPMGCQGQSGQATKLFQALKH